MRLLPDNTLLITINDWQSAGLTYDQYKWQLRNGKIQATRSCKGKPAEIYFDTIPDQYKSVIQSKLGDPRQNVNHRSFRDQVQLDHKAIEYYSNYKLADGRSLSTDHIREYSTNANVLNAIHKSFTTQSTTRKALGANMKGFWAKALNQIELVRGELDHTLPSNESRLRKKYLSYIEDGYEALISRKFCNDNSRKVTDDIERLIMSLYTMPNKPFAADVHTLYKQFLSGAIQVVDKKTGELFLPETFMKDGQPVEISESTVWNYLNQPQNRVIVDKMRSGGFQFNNIRRPHHHRNAPTYAFSKISMDDRDLPRLMPDGKRVKAYYSYDVASGCVIGWAHSYTKNEELFLDCMREMFRNIEKNNLPMPLEVEVENHLVSRFFDDLAIMFPFMRICNPGNSQEKHAEHFNKAKKYSVEKKNGHAIGRWWSRHEAYREDTPKIDDEYRPKYSDYKQLVADDIYDIMEYNNQLHPKQKKYPGKTRWQVLLDNINPTAVDVNQALVTRYIGYKVLTSINRSQYCTVQYNKFQLPNPEILSRLLPGNYNVEAYYLPKAEGMISEVYLYQNDVYLCKATPIEKYNTAKAEWTESDQSAYTEQTKYVSQFDKMAKDGKNQLASAVIIDSDVMNEIEQTDVSIVQPKTLKSDDFEDLLKEFNPDDFVQKSNESL